MTASSRPGASPMAPAISATSLKYASCGFSNGSIACTRTTQRQRFTASSTSSPSSDCAGSAHTSAGTGKSSMLKVNAHSVPSSGSSGLSPSSSWPSQAAKAVPISSRVGASVWGQNTTQPDGLGSGSSHGSSEESSLSGSGSLVGSLMQDAMACTAGHILWAAAACGVCGIWGKLRTRCCVALHRGYCAGDDARIGDLQPVAARHRSSRDGAPGVGLEARWHASAAHRPGACARKLPSRSLGHPFTTNPDGSGPASERGLCVFRQ